MPPTDFIAAASNAPARPRHGRLYRVVVHHLLPYVLIAAVAVAIKWPVFKGLYYLASGSSGPVEGIVWRTDLASAMVESQRTGKPVLLNFQADWCPSCQTMKHDVWSKPDIREAANARFTPVTVDGDRLDPAGPAGRFGVNSTPRILIIRPDGKVVGDAHYLSAAAMRRFLKLPA